MVEFITLGKKYKTDKDKVVEATTGEVLNGQIEFLNYPNAPRLTLVECAVEGGGYIYLLNTQLEELQ